MVNAVKVYKKTAPNGKITVYLGRRDFVDNTVTTEPVDGVVVFENDYLKGRKIFATVAVTYRFGREEDEVMGLNFSKELQLASQQIYPAEPEHQLTEVQDRLLKKLGASSCPFSITIPQNAPASAQLHTGKEQSVKPLGVIYELKVFVGDNGDEKPHKRNSVTLAVRKVQYAPVDRNRRQPSTMVSKGFAMSSGKINMEVNLDRDIFYHGESISPAIIINNGSRKTVKSIKCSVVQHIEMTMTNNHFTKEVACLESKEGCPITPGANLHKNFTLCPLASTNQNKFGVVLDGKLKDTDAHLASSTMCSEGANPNDATGIVVSYSVRVRLDCGALGGELMADLPFKLLHPTPGSVLGKSKGEGGEEIVFEDFARLRRGMSVDPNY